MLQTVATMVSLLLAIGAVAIIAASIAEDRDAMLRALGFAPAGAAPILPPQAPARLARRARVLRVRPQAASLRAAA